MNHQTKKYFLRLFCKLLTCTKHLLNCKKAVIFNILWAIIKMSLEHDLHKNRYLSLSGQDQLANHISIFTLTN
jgi:hypothetical protein